MLWWKWLAAAPNRSSTRSRDTDWSGSGEIRRRSTEPNQHRTAPAVPARRTVMFQWGVVGRRGEALRPAGCHEGHPAALVALTTLVRHADMTPRRPAREEVTFTWAVSVMGPDDAPRHPCRLPEGGQPGPRAGRQGEGARQLVRVRQLAALALQAVRPDGSERRQGRRSWGRVGRGHAAPRCGFGRWGRYRGMAPDRAALSARARRSARAWLLVAAADRAASSFCSAW